MAVFLISFLLILLAAAGLAAGPLFGRAPVKGSCDGLAGCDDCACREDGER